MSDVHGQFIWYELMSNDPGKAEAFYRDVVGWNVREAGQGYKAWLVGEAGVGGLLTLPEEARAGGARPAWVGYIGVDDVDASAAAIADAGGTVHRAPADIPGIGRFAMVADPQGVIFVIMAPIPQADAPPPPAPDPAVPGLFGWRELMTTDMEAAFAFYSRLFGWTKLQVVETPIGPYQLFATGGGTTGGEMTGGMMTKPAQVPVPFWTFYIQVDGIAAAMARVASAGGAIINGPLPVPTGGWIAQGLDTEGALFSLVSPNA
jgi:uncharacterized protein